MTKANRGKINSTFTPFCGIELTLQAHAPGEAGGGAGEVPGAVGRILYTQAGRQNRHQQHNGGKKHCRCCVTSRYLFEISI